MAVPVRHPVKIDLLVLALRLSVLIEQVLDEVVN
jgi:hypothetical protein